MKLLVAAFFITILLTVYSARIPPEERYRGFQVFQVFFKSHDNTSAIANYAKSKEKGVQVMKIDYLRGASEVAVSPRRYADVRQEFESGDLDNFNIIAIDLAEYVKENLGKVKTKSGLESFMKME